MFPESINLWCVLHCCINTLFSFLLLLTHYSSHKYCESGKCIILIRRWMQHRRWWMKNIDNWCCLHYIHYNIQPAPENISPPTIYVWSVVDWLWGSYQISWGGMATPMRGGAGNGGKYFINIGLSPVVVWCREQSGAVRRTQTVVIEIFENKMYLLPLLLQRPAILFSPTFWKLILRFSRSLSFKFNQPFIHRN